MQEVCTVDFAKKHLIFIFFSVSYSFILLFKWLSRSLNQFPHSINSCSLMLLSLYISIQQVSIMLCGQPGCSPQVHGSPSPPGASHPSQWLLRHWDRKVHLQISAGGSQHYCRTSFVSSMECHLPSLSLPRIILAFWAEQLLARLAQSSPGEPALSIHPSILPSVPISTASYLSMQTPQLSSSIFYKWRHCWLLWRILDGKLMMKTRFSYYWCKINFDLVMMSSFKLSCMPVI